MARGYDGPIAVRRFDSARPEPSTPVPLRSIMSCELRQESPPGCCPMKKPRNKTIRGFQEEGESFSHGTVIGREAFAKISEVEGIRLDDDAKAMFADFDRRKLSAEERRRAIVSRFKREAAE